MAHNDGIEFKNCYIPSDAYYIVNTNDTYMCPDSSINIVNFIEKKS